VKQEHDKTYTRILQKKNTDSDTTRLPDYVSDYVVYGCSAGVYYYNNIMYTKELNGD